MIIIALPMYNEEGGIGSLLSNIKNAMKPAKDYKVVILDDGSTDSSVKIVKSFSKKMPIKLIYHKANKGLGTTLKDIFRYVSGASKPSDVIVMMDADNTHNPILVREMAKKIDEGYNLVIASRFVEGGKEIGLSSSRKIYSRVIALILRLLFPIRDVRDYTCGYRAYSAGLLKKAHSFYETGFITATGFPAAAEILMKLRRFKLKASEVPLVLRYDLKRGKSKLKLFSTIKEYFKIICINKLTSKWKI